MPSLKTLQGSNNLKAKIIQTAAPRELKTSHDAKVSQVMHKHGLVLLQLQIPIISGAPACRRSQMQLSPGIECVRNVFKLMTETRLPIGSFGNPSASIWNRVQCWIWFSSQCILCKDCNFECNWNSEMYRWKSKWYVHQKSRKKIARFGFGQFRWFSKAKGNWFFRTSLTLDC